MNATNGISSLDKLLGSLRLNEGKAKTDVVPAQVFQPQPDQASVSVAGGLAAQAAGASDVRLDKVQQLQQAIASGTYNVPATAVADKLVETLLGR